MKAPRNMSPALVDTMSKVDGMDISPVASLYKALRSEAAWLAALASWSARMMRTMEGGMICPRVPDAQMVPVASGLEYPLRSIAGSEMSPIATTVAPTMPVVAARRAPTKTTDTPSPPGIGPKSWAIVTSRSSAIRERCSMIPMKMNNGIAISVSRSTSQ